MTPALVTGRLNSSNEEAHHYLAVAVNGIIRAVTRSYQEDAATRFSAMVPEASFRAGGNNVEILAIREVPGEALGLSRVPMSNVPYSLERTAGRRGESIRSAGGEIFAVSSRRVDGRVNRGVVRKEVIMFRGWAADVEAAAPADVILVFENDEFRFSGTAGRVRRAPGRGPAIDGSGFELTVPKSVFSDLGSAEIRFFAVSRQGYASELRTSRSFQWRKKEPPGG
ncbi:MAG: hypothetical protein GY953_43765 [bacterium]|nr:hypothetical protein [bacterium]